MPTATICTRGFDVMGRAEAKSLGVPGLPIVSINQEVIRGLEDLDAAADATIDEIIAVLTRAGEDLSREYRDKNPLEEMEKTITRPRLVMSYERLAAPGSVEDANTLFYDRGWTDGLPIIPPTAEAVERMLTYVDRPSDEIIATLAPRWGKATVEKIAVNVVMAGCLPEYMPVVITAVEAIADPAFNLFALQGTTNPVAPLAIINGPIAKELNVNGSFNAFGQGWRANATIGRAIRLIMMNIGGGLPGTTDKATHGQPGKYTFCVAENEADSPWEPLHVERGFHRDVSAVTVGGVHSTQNFLGWVQSAEGILALAANAMSAYGSNNTFYGGAPFVAISPLHARIISNAGYSKADVKRFLADNARIPISQIAPEALDTHKLKRPKLNWGYSGGSIPICDRWEDMMVFVCGSFGNHGVFLPTFGEATMPVTRPILLSNGKAAKSVQDFKITGLDFKHG